LQHGTAAIDSARLRLQAQDGRAPRGSVELDARGLALAGFKFTDLVARLNGDARAHDFALDAHGDPASVSLRLQGALGAGPPARRSWTGTLDQLALDVARVPPLKLAEPARIAVSRDAFELGNTCLAGGDIAVCASARRDPRSFAANYSLHALPLGILAALAAPKAEVTVIGTLEGQGDLRRANDGTFTGRATLASSAGSLSQRGDEKALVLEYRDFGVDIDLTREAARATLRGVLPRQGELDGAITLAVAESDPSLGGRAALELRDLAPLAIWVPQLANLKGSGEVAAEMGGTLHAPRVGVTVRATGLDAEVPLLGVHLREGNFTARLTPEGNFEADGSIRSGEGTLRATGTRAADRRLELKLSGSDFLAASIPGARVTMAPDLSLSGKDGSLALTGSVKIEDADVNLEKLSFAKSYKASPDVVVVDRQIEVKQSSLGLTTDVRVILGDRVKLAGFGLESTVNGELRVQEARDQPSRATARSALPGLTRRSAASSTSRAAGCSSPEPRSTIRNSTSSPSANSKT
jgi:translocation and assembly module TamB